MKIDKSEETAIAGIKILVPHIHVDYRGNFFESYNSNDFTKLGLPNKFVQDNQVFSIKGVLRGLHYQLKFPQGKLVRVVLGEVFDVAVDIRIGSPTFGKYLGIKLSSENNKTVYLPAGVAHGYLVLSEKAIFQYKCTEIYRPEDEFGLLWNDKDINVQWSVEKPILSVKDKNLKVLKNINTNNLPIY